MNKQIVIDSKLISENSPTFVIAELSANHLMDYGRAIEIVRAAKEAGADAIKLQTYTADTITIDSDNDYFKIKQGTIWDGTTLHKLYQEAYMPWEWQPKLMRFAKDLGLVCFSSPFDFTAVDYMVEMDMPAYKIASFEINDIPLIRKVAATNKPIIISTGIAHLEDIDRALQTCKEVGNENVILLKCTSSYPAPYEDINLRIIPNMKQTFDCIVGLSDHTMGTTVSIGAVALGAKIVEKHLTISRSDGGADSKFSMEPHEFKEMVNQIRIMEKALGWVTYDLTEGQKKSRELSRSLFVVKEMKAGETFTKDNVRSIRPGYGLHTMYFEEILGKTAITDIKKGTPLSWGIIK